MKKAGYSLFFLFLVCFSFPGSAEETAFFSRFEREEINRMQAAAVLREWALSGNLIVEEHPLLESTGGFGSNLIARIPASGGKDGTFVLALPLYGNFAVDSGLAFIAALQDAANLEKTRGIEILAAFLGDERTSLPADAGGLSHKGLRELLSTVDMPENWVLCYLDLEDEPEGLLIRHGDGEYLAPLELVEPLKRLSRLRNIPADFEIRYNEFHKLELAGRAPELALAWDAEINAVSLTSTRKQGSSTISPGTMAEMLLDYSGSFDFPVKNPDRHYNFFHVAGFVFFMNERTSVQLLVWFMGFLVLMTLVYFTRWRRRIFLRRFGLKFFSKYSWLFILFLPLLTLTLKVSSLFYGTILSVFRKPVPGADYPGMILVMLLGLVLFSYLLQLPDLLRTIKGNFYGLSALFLSTMGLFSAILLDLTYAPIFAWISFFSFLGLLAAKNSLVFIAAFLIPLHAVGALLNLWGIGAHNLPDILLASGGTKNWMAYFQISLILLPAVLLFKKGIMISKKQKPAALFSSLKARLTRRRIFGRKIPVLHLGVPAFVVFLILIYAIILPGKKTPPVRRSLEAAGSLLELSLDDTVFEESRILGLTIRTLNAPARFDIILESDNGERPLVYSAPGPLEEQGEGRLAVVLGEAPPNPFSTEIVLSSDFTGFLRVEALYTGPENIDREFFQTKEKDYLLRIWKRERIAPVTTSGNQGLKGLPN